ncbi:hypothetical protein G7Y89_g13822 [Cudoniella acicularis]|uniref:Heterokaryon incompatibility domain-containing protein n=1 Tax=Cudoniella acicularis TaxID=354080 RepID=A0A8H4R6I0_9HELO|nr:hypothetical protein G7Y89_g13822 [Cudoniella acicularis]
MSLLFDLVCRVSELDLELELELEQCRDRGVAKPLFKEGTTYKTYTPRHQGSRVKFPTAQHKTHKDNLNNETLRLSKRDASCATGMHYSLLNTTRNEIRLLTLLPSSSPSSNPNPTSEVQCTLTHASLFNPPPYIALSYHWGLAKDTLVSITLNGQPFNATANLKAALIQLQKSGLKTLWIDAVCIDQENAEEKSQQILQMGAIYRKATMTIAWLGEENETSGTAFLFIERFWEFQQKSEQEVSSLKIVVNENRNGEMKPGITIFNDEQDAVNAIAAFLHLLRRPYWRRIWIIQELALSRTIEILCGPHKTPWSKLENALRQMKIFYWRQVDAHTGFTRLLNIQKFREDAMSDKPVHFLEAIGRSQSSLATEERDKVFAVLQLAYNGNAFIPVPNYLQDVGDLCRDITMSAISLSRSLDVIAFLGNSKDGMEEPTWVPHWLATTSRWGSRADERRFRYLLGNAQSRVNNPSSGQRVCHTQAQGTGMPNLWYATRDSQIDMQLKGPMLSVKGFIIDEVTTLSCTFDGSPGISSNAPPSNKIPQTQAITNNNPYRKPSSFSSSQNPTPSPTILKQHKFNPRHLPILTLHNQNPPETFETLFHLFFSINNTPNQNVHYKKQAFQAFYTFWPYRLEKQRDQYPALFSWFTLNASLTFHGRTLDQWLRGRPSHFPTISISNFLQKKHTSPPSSSLKNNAFLPSQKSQKEEDIYATMQQALQWNMSAIDGV